MIFRWASTWAVAVLLAGACGSACQPGREERPSTRAAPAASNTLRAASPRPTPTPAADAGPRANEVTMGDHFIDPQVLVVNAGTTVTWRNSSGYHDVTSRDGLFKSPTLGDSYSFTFTEPGRYLYYCSFHSAEMRGEVIVQPAD